MLSLVFLIVAFVLFLAAAFNLQASGVNLTAAGLAFWVLSLLVARGGL